METQCDSQGLHSLFSVQEFVATLGCEPRQCKCQRESMQEAQSKLPCSVSLRGMVVHSPGAFAVWWQFSHYMTVTEQALHYAAYHGHLSCARGPS